MASSNSKQTAIKNKSQPNKLNTANNNTTIRNAPVSMKLAFLLGLISFIVYANALNNSFTMDDTVMIVKNTIVTKGVRAIPELFSTPHQRGYWAIPNDEYRPLSLVLFCIEYQFFANAPMPYHFINICLFAACVVLLFYFLDKFFDAKKTAVAFITALLFALHPIHTEVVANVKSGDELLCFFFAFLSLNIFINYIKDGRLTQLAVGVLCLFLSFLSKETSFTFLIIIPLIFFIFKKEDQKRNIKISVCILVAAVIFLVIRYSILNHHNANNVAKIDITENMLVNKSLSLESRIATTILILGLYVKLLFVPYPLICDYSYDSLPYTHFNNPLVLATMAFYICVLFLIFRRLTKDRRDPYAFGMLFFLITISIISNIPFLIKSTMAERFMFFPSAGFCLIVALLIEKWARNDQKIIKLTKVLSLLIPLSIIYIVIITERNKDWRDNYTLYKTDIEKVPDNSRLNYLLGYELLNMAKQEENKETKMSVLDEAISFTRRSLAIHPDYYFAEIDNGEAYFLKGQYDSAEIYYLAAIRLFPNLMIPRTYLSGIYLTWKQYQKDIELCKESIILSPDYVAAFADIAESYLQLGKYDSAVQYLNQGITINPKFYAFYAVYSDLYTKTGNRDSAKKYEIIAQNLSSPGN